MTRWPGYDGYSIGMIPVASFVLLVAALIAAVIVWIEQRPKTVPCINLPKPTAADRNWKGRTRKLGKEELQGSQLIPCTCPSTGFFLGCTRAASKDEINEAVASAHSAQSEWKKTTFAQRDAVLDIILRYILENQELIATVSARDSGSTVFVICSHCAGKTLVDAALGEILMTVEKLRWTLAHGKKALRPDHRPTNLLMCYKSARVEYEPLGVVLACVSWNYPFHNLLSPIISSIYAGNAIVVKGSEQTAWSSQFYIQIVHEALRVCGHDRRIVQNLVCWPENADSLTSHPLIRHITFIGSREVGVKVAKSAAQNLVPVTMELGGKDPAILLDDIKDVGSVVSILMRGVFQSSAQNCVGIERIVVLEKIYSQVTEELRRRINTLRVGPPLGSQGVDMGAMLSLANIENVEAMINKAVMAGARLLCGGSRLVFREHPNGLFFKPTLLVDVTPDMEIAQKELFAPVALCMKARNIDEAIDIANSTMYALGASVFGSSKADLDRCVREVEAGNVSVNDFATYYVTQLPFGGIKGSGYGRFCGPEGLRSLCNGKSISSDIFPFISTRIPRILDYPIHDFDRAWQFINGLATLGYAPSLGAKYRGLLQMLFPEPNVDDTQAKEEELMN